jgi:uncharacterized protein
MKINKKEIWIQSAGEKLYCVLEEPKNPNNTIVILLHGLTNNHLNCPLIDDTAKALQGAGFSTFRFDYVGSGKSDGNFIDKTWHILVQNTKDVLEYVKTRYKYQKITIWGRSLGAMFGATICDDPSIYSSVLLSFTIHTNISLSSSFPIGKQFSLPIIGTAIVKGEPILHRQFYEETNWIDQLQKIHLTRAKNVLIIQGTEDKTIYNLAWAKEIYDLINEPKKLLYIKGANHAYKGYEQKVINEAVNWFGKIM